MKLLFLVAVLGCCEQKSGAAPVTLSSEDRLAVEIKPIIKDAKKVCSSAPDGEYEIFTTSCTYTHNGNILHFKYYPGYAGPNPAYRGLSPFDLKLNHVTFTSTMIADIIVEGIQSNEEAVQKERDDLYEREREERFAKILKDLTKKDKKK